MKKHRANSTLNCGAIALPKSLGLKSVISVAVAILIATILWLQVAIPIAYAQTIEVGNTDFTFASIADGVAVLQTEDDFITRLSPFDRSARLKTDEEVSPEDYLNFLGNNVLAWKDAEIIKIGTALNNIKDTLGGVSDLLPPTITLVKTTGDEEGGAAYTRGEAIMFPKGYIDSQGIQELQALIAHEVFHVLSRRNPSLRDDIYAIIGFESGNEIELPSELQNIKITNPDAPINNHYIELTITSETQNCQSTDCVGTPYWTVPILLATSEYDTCKGGEFFDYLLLQFLVVNRVAEGVFELPDGEPQLFGLEKICDFYDQVGKNTDYIIHPEEILADNFVKLIVPNPEILFEMATTLGNAVGL